MGSAITAHHVHSPEIKLIDPNTADVIWAMQDRVIYGPDRRSQVQYAGHTGFGHYHERYVRQNGRWRIAKTKLTRLHSDKMILSRDPWLDMLLVPAGRNSISAKSVPAVVAYVHSDSSLSADRCEQLAQLFDLLPSEARLALALGRGMSIAEAAKELNLTEGSARTYTKKIYAKMGARGHPDLVRFVQRSVLQIA
jgi:DNA-binding CsgD family transcriptional regulator